MEEESRRQTCMGYHSEGGTVNCKERTPMEEEEEKEKEKEKRRRKRRRKE